MLLQNLCIENIKSRNPERIRTTCYFASTHITAIRNSLRLWTRRHHVIINYLVNFFSQRRFP